MHEAKVGALRANRYSTVRSEWKPHAAAACSCRAIMMLKQIEIGHTSNTYCFAESTVAVLAGFAAHGGDGCSS
jgi:hypothetical protein